MLERVRRGAVAGLIGIALGVAWVGGVGAAVGDQPAATPVAPERPAKLRVATKVFKPFSFKADDDWVGFSVDLWDAIALDLELDYEWVDAGSVRSLLQKVESGDCQVGIAGISLTQKREGMVDFSFPFFESGLQVMVRNDDRGGGSFITATLLPLLLRVGGAGLLILLGVAHLVWLAERKKNPGMFPASYRQGIWDSFWWAAVTLTTVGYGDRIPKSRAGRSVALMWMFSGIILISFFTASVTTGLTINRLEGTIAGPNDLGGRPVGTVRGSTAAKWLATSTARQVDFDTIEQAYDAIRRSEIEAIVYDFPALRFHSARAGKGTVETVGPVFQRQSYGIALVEGSPYRERVNLSILKLRESGVYESIYKKWFGD